MVDAIGKKEIGQRRAGELISAIESDEIEGIAEAFIFIGKRREIVELARERFDESGEGNALVQPELRLEREVFFAGWVEIFCAAQPVSSPSKIGDVGFEPRIRDLPCNAREA